MLLLLLIANGVCLVLAARLLLRLAQPVPASATAESFAAALTAARPAGAAVRLAGQPLWIPWHDKEPRTC
jgi:hypothetical protein